MVAYLALLLVALASVSGYPSDQIIRKLDDGPRYQHVAGPDGRLHLVDMWLKISDLAEIARYNPDTQNIYHLFTRQNPVVSQPLLTGNEGLIGSTNFNANRRTAIILHGWLENVLADVNTVLVPAFLAAEDMNVIVVDWGAGANTINYVAAVSNTLTSGESVARFIDWLNLVTRTTPSSYHIVGHSLGAHQAGIIGRNVIGNVAYITALDAALPGWITNDHKLRENDGAYTEVIHTNAGLLGYLGTLGHVDFYPNGGINMPGCNSQECDHDRSFHYFGESLTSGGFTGRRCATFAGAMSGNCVLWGNLNMGGLVPKTGSFHYFGESLISGGFIGQRCATFVGAMTGNCVLWGNLNMGGLVPKTGRTGIFYLETNASPPFSQS